MVVTIEFKKSMTGACVFHIIISEFGNWKEYSLIFLIIIYRRLKIGLHNAVLSFRLAICLKMEGN